jgi:hypothetical protein
MDVLAQSGAVNGHAPAYRRLFRAAAVYNFAFAAWSVLMPQHWFRLVGAPEDERSEGLWQCIGMILGLYGILYWHVANHPASGR